MTTVRRDRVAVCLVHHPRGYSWFAPGLHRSADWVRRCAAGGSNGPRDVDGIGVCGGGHLFRGTTRGQCGGNRRYHRNAHVRRLCDCHWVKTSEPGSRIGPRPLPGHRSALPLLFAPALVGIFSQDPEVVPYGVRCLLIVAAGFLFYGYGMVLTMAFNGAGDTRTPTLINLACLWFLEIPLAWVLAYPVGLGPTGVFIAVSVGFSTLALVSAWMFSRGTWKTQRV